MRALIILGLVSLIVIAGCAPTSMPAPVASPGPVTPYSTPAVEADRAACLAANLLWLETQDRYACIPPESLPGAGRVPA